MLTQTELKELVVYDEKTGVFTWAKRRGNYREGSVCGGITGRGYVQIQINGKNHYAHRLAWLYMTGALPSLSIDHINGNKTDNKFLNLREATHAQNIWNRPPCKKREFVGTSKHGNKWRASAIVNGKFSTLGFFDTRQEAADSYEEFIKKQHGEFCHLNNTAQAA